MLHTNVRVTDTVFQDMKSSPLAWPVLVEYSPSQLRLCCPRLQQPAASGHLSLRKVEAGMMAYLSTLERDIHKVIVLLASVIILLKPLPPALSLC